LHLTVNRGAGEATITGAKAVTAERLGQMTAEEYEAYGRVAREGNIKLN